MDKPDGDLMREDLYDLLGIEDFASEKIVTKAYRKKALKVHPDKNPSPEAAQQFRRLVEIHKILTDPAARAAYDASLRNRRAREERLATQSADRKRARLDLEERERRAGSVGSTSLAESRLQREIERLRREWPDIMEREKQLLKEKLDQEDSTSVASMSKQKSTSSACLKAKWPITSIDKYDRDEAWLRSILSKVGGVVNIIISPKRPGVALIEMQSPAVARAAISRASAGMLEDVTLQLVGSQSSEDQVIRSRDPELLKETRSLEDMQNDILSRIREQAQKSGT